MKYELIKYCEFDKYAQKSYDAIHGTTQEDNLGDVCEADFTSLNQADLIVGGSPCFVAGSKVLTDKGYKNIEDIIVGDSVLTHENRFKNVLRIGGETNKDIYSLKAQGFLNILATENHPFYVKKDKFHNPEKIKLKDIKRGFYLGSHINIQESNIHNLTNETCWILGRYVADGHIRYDKRKHRKNSYQYGVILSVGDNKIEDVKNNIKNMHYSCYKHTQSTYRVVISSMELVKFILDNNFGTSAREKSIPNFILDLPKDKLKSFLDGYMSGDGCYIEKLDLYSATTISEKLALSLCAAIQKVYSTGCRIYKNKRPKTTIIQGRIVNQNEDYIIRFSKNKNKKYSWFIDGNVIWYPVKSIEKTSRVENVFNIEVDEDHTYTVNNAITYNCQDFSIAGNKKGSAFTCLDCGAIYNPIEQHWSKRDKCPVCESGNLEKTRSSLLIEYLRAIRENKPKFFIYENVKNITSKTNKVTFDLFRKELNEYGYSTYYKVLNAKNYGVPQNRERVFVVGIRKDIDKGFEFPEGFDSGAKVDDILESSVDEKYYLTNSRVKLLLDLLEGKSLLDGGRFCADSTINDPSKRDISNCITSRYDAGIQNQKQIGLVVVEPNEMIIKGNTVPSEHTAGRVFDINGVSPTVMYRNAKVVQILESKNKANEKRDISDYSVRKLTPKECWRLMGFDDESYEKASEVNSNAQLYKQAGNSIVVDCLYYIYKKLQEFYPNDFKENLSLISLFSGIGAFEKGLERL